MPKVSICVPYHEIPETDFFLNRLSESIAEQTFTDYELICTEDGKMAANTNSAISRAKGNIIKVMFMDDYFAHPNALKEMVEDFKGGWMATGCIHDGGGELFNVHMPEDSPEILKGINKLGSPSVIMVENNLPLMDENLSWLIDCDWYHQLYQKYGKPTLRQKVDIVIGVGDHQTTNTMSDEEKLSEHGYLQTKYG